MTCPNCGRIYHEDRCPNCERLPISVWTWVGLIVLLVVVALPSAMGGCAVAVGTYSLFGPGGFWAGAPAIVFGVFLIAICVVVVILVRNRWKG